MRSYNKYFELTNHLGSVLNVVTDRKIPIDSDNNGIVDYYTADVIGYADYYPFGSYLPNRHGGTLGRYGFQNQEVDPEIKGEGNSVNYKYRMHDPRLGRFFSVDPLADKYPHNSPYAFSENVVINAVELEGLERHYTFNSASKSAQALTVIKKGNYNDILNYVNSQVRGDFVSPASLNYAKKMLGHRFNEGAGYSADGYPTNSTGNHSVVASYKNTQEELQYFDIRLVIDNGNGTWGTQTVKVTNPVFIKNEIKKVDESLTEVASKIAVLNQQIKNDEIFIHLTDSHSIINTSDKKDGRADAYAKIGQELARWQIRSALPGKINERDKLMKKESALKNQKQKLEKTETVVIGKVEN